MVGGPMKRAHSTAIRLVDRPAGGEVPAERRPPIATEQAVPRGQRRCSTSLACDPGLADTPWVSALPILLTIGDVADLLRTTRRAVYAMVERQLLPVPVRIGRRVLMRRDDLLRWLDAKRAA
jgi:excisionase family DNA binding protein